MAPIRRFGKLILLYVWSLLTSQVYAILIIRKLDGRTSMRRTPNVGNHTVYVPQYC